MARVRELIVTPRKATFAPGASGLTTVKRFVARAAKDAGPGMPLAPIPLYPKDSCHAL